MLHAESGASSQGNKQPPPGTALWALVGKSRPVDHLGRHITTHRRSKRVWQAAAMRRLRAADIPFLGMSFPSAFTAPRNPWNALATEPQDTACDQLR